MPFVAIYLKKHTSHLHRLWAVSLHKNETSHYNLNIFIITEHIYIPADEMRALNPSGDSELQQL